MDNIINEKQLFCDLLIAYYNARKHKSNKSYVQEFDVNLTKNLMKLKDDLLNKTYIPEPFTIFAITDPKPREILAARFRDRIVHHLYFEYTHELFESTFISDCYSNIKNRGTSYGINRLKHHIASESKNYTQTCYVLKLDIRAYFININRLKLFNIVTDELNKFKIKYPDRINYDLINYLSRVIILTNPLKDAILKGDRSRVPKSKSLFYAKSGYGLPLGNLTSQLFSNVFLNKLDQYVKRELKAKHYGRYVDDFYIVSKDKNFLRSAIIKIRDFLRNELDLELHEGKILIRDVRYGVEFLGAYIKPYRTYISNQTLRRMRVNSKKWKSSQAKLQASISQFGLLSQYKSFNIRKSLL